MNKETETQAPKKGFWARLLDNVDKKMQEKASSGGGCCCGDPNGSCVPKTNKDK